MSNFSEEEIVIKLLKSKKTLLAKNKAEDLIKKLVHVECELSVQSLTNLEKFVFNLRDYITEMVNHPMGNILFGASQAGCNHL